MVEKAGTAQGRINIVENNAFPFILGLSIINAKQVPTTSIPTVTATVQTSVHIETYLNDLAYSPEKIDLKLAQPTHSSGLPGGM